MINNQGNNRNGNEIEKMENQEEKAKRKKTLCLKTFGKASSDTVLIVSPILFREPVLSSPSSSPPKQTPLSLLYD